MDCCSASSSTCRRPANSRPRRTWRWPTSPAVWLARWPPRSSRGSEMAGRREPRGPAPAAQLAAVQRELARGWPAGLTVLTGTDGYHLDAAQHALLERLAPADQPLARSVYGTERVDV